MTEPKHVVSPAALLAFVCLLRAGLPYETVAAMPARELAAAAAALKANQ